MSASVWAPDPTQVPIYPALSGSGGSALIGNNIQIVPSIAALKLLSKLSPSKYAEVLSYYGDNKTQPRLYYCDLSDTTTPSNYGTVIVGVDGGRWKMVNSHINLTMNDFGATGAGGLTDDSIYMQAALTYMDSIGGGDIGILNGTYNITVPLITNTGTLLKAQTLNDLSVNTNGSGVSAVTIKWTGASTPGALMYTIKPAVVGNTVWGGGIENIEFDCNALILGAAHFDNTKNTLFDGKILSPTFYGLLVSSLSGTVTSFSQLNRIRRVEFVYGYSSACDAANAVVIQGNGSTVPSTQQQIGVIQGLIKNGYGLVIQEADNCNAEFISMACVGTGGALRFAPGGAQQPNFNVIKYVAGKIDWGSSAVYGNIVMRYISEGGNFINPGQWNGQLIDYVNSRTYTSHLYQMRKWLQVNSGDWKGDTNTLQGNLAGIWPALNMPKSGIARVGSIITPDYDMANGNLVSMEFEYSTNNAGGNLRMVFSISTITHGIAGTVVTPRLVFTATLPQALQYTVTKYSLTISPIMPYNIGDVIAVSVQRLPADPLDTATGEVFPLGLRLNYQSLGPDSPGSGTYTAPDWA
jgi:hypothetical protein